MTHVVIGRANGKSMYQALRHYYEFIHWILTNCPNRRVAYLSSHGKTHRVRTKNFKRAVKLVEEKFIRIGKQS